MKESLRRLAARIARTSLARHIVPRLGRSGILPWRLLRHLPTPELVVVSPPQGRSFRYAPAPDDSVGRQLHWLGVSRAGERAVLLPFARAASRARVVIDVGANVGLYSLVALAVNPSVSVYAFEPVPATADRLLENVNLNGWGGRLRLVTAALGDRKGQTAFHVPHGSWPTSASLHPSGFRGLPGAIITVELDRLDDFGIELMDTDLLKVDVEGFEEAVLRGADRMLGNRPTLILECHRDHHPEVLDGMLTTFGYEIHRLLPSGPSRLDGIAEAEGDDYRNFLCVARH